MNFEFAQRYLSRLDAPPSAAERAHMESALALVRILLALLSLLAVTIDSTEPANYARLVYGLLVVWILYSIVIFFLVRARGVSSRGLVCLHAGDILFALLLTGLTFGPSSPFFVLFSFALLGAGFRWGLIESMATALIGVALLDLEAMFFTASTEAYYLLREGQFAINSHILRCVYIIVLGYVIGMLGENEKERRAEASVLARVLREAHAENSIAEILRTVMRECLRIFAGEQAYVVARDIATERTFLWHGFDPATPQLLPQVSELANDAALLRGLPETFYCRQTRSQVLLLAFEGEDTRWRTLPQFPPLDFPTGEVRSLLASGSTFGAEWSIRVLVVNAKLGGDRTQELRFAETLLKQAISSLYSVFLVRQLRNRVGALERARVSRELHDGVIQSLISAEMRVDVLRRRAERDSNGISTELGLLQKLLREEVTNLRDLMQQMKPLDFPASQFLDHLAEVVDRFGRETGIRSTFSSDVEEVTLNPHTCRELVRIVQEALVNVRKHAHASQVGVAFCREDHAFRLTITDDGTGFSFDGRIGSSELMSSAKGPGVIKERVREIGGELILESHPGQGSRLDIRLATKGHATYAE